MNTPRQDPDPAGPDAFDDAGLDAKKLLREAIAGGDVAGAAGAWQPPTIEDLAARFPELEIVELIGRGGMGAVFRAVQSRLARTVALKVLPPALAADPAFEERFLREARALAGLQHPRILTVHDFGERDGLYYLVTEFVEGMNLRQLMDMGELSPTEALRIAPQICEALQFAHDHGVVHRDIKPENLLIDTKGEVKIADFGLARMLGDADAAPALTRSTQVLGTPQYMAPEQWRHGVPIDHRADIYSVGVVLYEMLTGQLPLGHFDPPSRRQGVPPGLDEVVRRSLAQQPDERYQRASDVGDDVRRQQPVAGAACAGKAAREQRHRADRHPGQPEGARAGVPMVLKFAWLVLIVGLFGGAALAHRHFEEQSERAGVAIEQQQLRYEAEAWARSQQISGDAAVLVERYLREVAVPAWQRSRQQALQRGERFVEPEPTLRPEPNPRGSTPFGMWLMFVIGFALVQLMMGGFAAIRRIRTRRRGTAGLGLAIFTAWVVPIGIAIAVPAMIFDANLRDGDTAVLAGTFVGVLLGIGGIFWMVSHYRRLASELA